jgi:hypothetical protein
MAHTGLDPVLDQALPVTVRPILTPTVRMHEESRGRLPLRERHG